MYATNKRVTRDLYCKQLHPSNSINFYIHDIKEKQSTALTSQICHQESKYFLDTEKLKSYLYEKIKEYTLNTDSGRFSLNRSVITVLYSFLISIIQ